MNKSVEFGVLIATYTRDWSLPKALESVGKQKMLPKLICVVDDAPSPVTRGIVDSFKGKVKCDVIYLEHHGESGAIYSRNWAARQMDVEYIALLDDDDQWDESYLKRAKEIVEGSGADIVLSGFVEFNMDGVEVGRSMPPRELNRSHFMVSNPGAVTSNVIFKKSAFVEVNGYNPELKSSADRGIFVEMEAKGFTYVLNEEYLVRRLVEHGDQWSADYGKLIVGKMRFAKRYWPLMTVDERCRTVVKLSLIWIQVGREWLSGIFRGIVGKSKGSRIV